MDIHNKPKVIIDREVYYLNNVCSDFCIKYYGINLTDTQLNIYMEYCEGWNKYRTLRDYI